MPYVIVRRVMNPGTAQVYHLTTIEGAIREDTIKQLAITRKKEGSCTYETAQPPYEVLNILETEGYKVVGTNAVTHSCADQSSHYLIWTLHKQA